MKYILDESLETDYLKENYIGKIFDSKKCGKFKVIGVNSILNTNHSVLVIEFLNTKYQTIASTDEINIGNIKDNYIVTVRDVGYLGDIPVSTYREEKEEYNVWAGVLSRCYPSARTKWVESYENCSVENDWHNFSTFLTDCYELPNAEFKFKNINEKVKFLRLKSDFLESENLKSKISNLAKIRDKIENDKFENIRWQLDKDILTHGNKTYSKNNCCWIPDKINTFFNNVKKNNQSGFEGVRKPNKGSLFVATISTTKGEQQTKISLGKFKNPILAYEAYSLKRAEILEGYLEEYWYMDDDIKNACRNKLWEQTKETISKNSEIVNFYASSKTLNDYPQEIKYKTSNSISKKTPNLKTVEQKAKSNLETQNNYTPISTDAFQLAEKSWEIYKQTSEDDVYDCLKSVFINAYVKQLKPDLYK